MILIWSFKPGEAVITFWSEPDGRVLLELDWPERRLCCDWHA